MCVYGWRGMRINLYKHHFLSSLFFFQLNKKVFHSYIFPLPKHTWEKIKFFFLSTHFCISTIFYPPTFSSSNQISRYSTLWPWTNRVFHRGWKVKGRKMEEEKWREDTRFYCLVTRKKGGENWWSRATFPLLPTKNKSPQINKRAKTGAYSLSCKKSILPNYFILT